MTFIETKYASLEEIGQALKVFQTGINGPGYVDRPRVARWLGDKAVTSITLLDGSQLWCREAVLAALSAETQKGPKAP